MRHVWLLGALLSILCVGLVPLSAEETAPEKVNLVEGMKFPPFAGDTWDGQPFDFAPRLNQGKYILVDFWASWCGPCMKEMPHVTKIMNEYQNDRFEIVTISLDSENSRTRLAQAIADHGLTFPVITDYGYWDSRFAKQYGIRGIPANFLLAPDGTIIMRDLRGERLVDIARRIATDPTFEYEPISINMTIADRPVVNADNPEVDIDQLTIDLAVTNPQVASGDLTMGVKVVTWTDTGDVTLYRMADGSYRKNKEGVAVEYAVAHMSEEELYTLTVSNASGGPQSGRITIPVPDGAMMLQIIPYTYSPRLGEDAEGKGEWPRLSTRPMLDQEDLEAQGGRIDPAAADEESAAGDA